jgi:hypothetical protein
MIKTYQVRYNNQSKDDSTSWRLISEGKEIFVSDVLITSQTCTTKDYIEEIGEYKYHITCTGHLTIQDNVAYITKGEEIHITKN